MMVQWNPDFTNLQGKRKSVRKIGEFEKSGVKLQCWPEWGGGGKTFGSSYRELSRNRDSTVIMKNYVIITIE